MAATTTPDALIHETRMQSYHYRPVQSMTTLDLNAALLVLPFEIILMHLRSTAVRELEVAYTIQLKSAEEFSGVCSAQFRDFEEAMYTELERFCCAL